MDVGFDQTMQQFCKLIVKFTRHLTSRGLHSPVFRVFRESIMEQNIEGKVIVITGASSGLGEATARLLSGQGACVVLGARRVDRLLRWSMTSCGKVVKRSPSPPT